MRETPVEAPGGVESPPAKAGSPKREGYQGFRGRVYARVLERRDKVRLPLKVGEVLAVRDASEAAAPARLAGETISIVMPRSKDGDPERDHAGLGHRPLRQP